MFTCCSLKKSKSLSRIIIILIPRVHFNHINLQYADKGLELEKTFSGKLNNEIILFEPMRILIIKASRSILIFN